MKEVRVEKGQTLIDITMQELGDVERLFEVAKLNSIGITDDLLAGSVIMVPDFDPEKKEIVKMFKDPGNKPSSDNNCNEISNQGIEYWAIEESFIVS